VTVALERRTCAERSASAEAYRRRFAETFGPVIALRAAHAGDPGRAAALDADLATFAENANLGSPGEPARYARRTKGTPSGLRGCGAPHCTPDLLHLVVDGR